MPLPKPRPKIDNSPSHPPKRSASARFATVNRFVDVQIRDLTRAEMAVWLVLYRDTKKDGTVRTGQTDIAKRAGISRVSVSRAITTLTKRGLLTVIRQGGIDSGPSIYRIN